MERAPLYETDIDVDSGNFVGYLQLYENEFTLLVHRTEQQGFRWRKYSWQYGLVDEINDSSGHLVILVDEGHRVIELFIGFNSAPAKTITTTTSERATQITDTTTSSPDHQKERTRRRLEKEQTRLRLEKERFAFRIRMLSKIYRRNLVAVAAAATTAQE